MYNERNMKKKEEYHGMRMCGEPLKETERISELMKQEPRDNIKLRKT